MFKKIFLSLLVGLVFTGQIIAQGVDYYLPYPGILPDHPLYWLKMVRDRAGLLVVTSKMAKAEKLLLYADKRLGAAWALIDGNKVPLGVSTLTKGEKYLEQAVSVGGGASFRAKLVKAVLKHEEVISRLKDGAGDEFASHFDALLVKLQVFKDQLGVSQAAPAPVEVAVKFDQKKTITQAVTATTAFAALEKLAQEKGWTLATKDYAFGKLVESIDGVKSNQKLVWIFYVNGAAADRASDKFELRSGDEVEWRYEAVKP